MYNCFCYRTYWLMSGQKKRDIKRNIVNAIKRIHFRELHVSIEIHFGDEWKRSTNQNKLDFEQMSFTFPMGFDFSKALFRQNLNIADSKKRKLSKIFGAIYGKQTEQCVIAWSNDYILSI